MACGERSGGCAAGTMTEGIRQEEFGAGRFFREVIGRLGGAGAGVGVSLECHGSAPHTKLHQTTAGSLLCGPHRFSIPWISYASSLLYCYCQLTERCSIKRMYPSSILSHCPVRDVMFTVLFDRKWVKNTVEPDYSPSPISSTFLASPFFLSGPREALHPFNLVVSVAISRGITSHLFSCAPSDLAEAITFPR